MQEEEETHEAVRVLTRIVNSAVVCRSVFVEEPCPLPPPAAALDDPSRRLGARDDL